MNTNKSRLTIPALIVAGALLVTATLGFVGCSTGHDHSSHSHGTAAAKPYPLKTCIVTDEKLGGHGKPYTIVHEGQEIQLCCEDCLADFKKEPAKYLSKLSASK